MSERRVRQLLDSTPGDEQAEARAWEIVHAAYAQREPRRRPRQRVRLVLACGAVAALAAAAFSQPGRAVVNAVRRSIGIEHAQPALFRLPTGGRVLVAGESGAWVVAADGSKRRLGDYAQASWSPHGLYVVAASTDELAAVTPGGTVHWTLSRPRIRFPRWGGTRTDTRIAYLTASRLHVVGGDGTGDVGRLPAAAPVPPVWQPTAADRHILAYVTARGRVTVLDADRGSVRWVSAAYAGPRALAWSPDGTQLALATRTEVVLFDARTGRPTGGPRRRACAPSPSRRDGRLALLRGRRAAPANGQRVCARCSSRPAAGSAASPGRPTAAGCSPSCRPPTNGSSCRREAGGASSRSRTSRPSSARSPRSPAGAPSSARIRPFARLSFSRSWTCVFVRSWNAMVRYGRLAGHVDGDGEIAEVDDRVVDERVLAHGDRRLQLPCGRRGGEAAAAGDDVRDLPAVDLAREALVEMGVAGEDGVGPEPGLARGVVDVVREAGAAAVLAVDGRRRMMAGDDHGSLARLARGREPLQLRAQEVELVVAGERRVVAAL